MKIFFNNSCSICRSEINVYKKQGIKKLEWIDITDNKNAEKDTQKTAKDLLRRLHVKSDGKVYSGAKAFIILWNSMPKFKLLGKIFSFNFTFSNIHLFFSNF